MATETQSAYIAIAWYSNAINLDAAAYVCRPRDDIDGFDVCPYDMTTGLSGAPIRTVLYTDALAMMAAGQITE